MAGSRAAVLPKGRGRGRVIGEMRGWAKARPLVFILAARIYRGVRCQTCANRGVDPA